MSSSRVSYGNPYLKTPTVTPVKDFNTLNLEQVGFVGGVRSHITEEEIVRLEKFGVQLALAEAKNNALAPELDGLSVRNIWPGNDFQDGNASTIQMKQWRQPWSGTYTNTSGEFEVYRTNKNVDYDKKIYSIWGLRYVNQGPGRLDNIVHTSVVTFKDSAGNTYDSWQCEALDIHPELYAWTPIVFSNTRQLKVFVYPKVGHSGSFDNVELMGCVVERRGDNVNGLQRPDALSST